MSPDAETEAELTHIWSDVLSIPTSSIDVEANFFELGGDSVLMASVADRVVSHFFADRPDDAPGIAEYFAYGTIRAFSSRLVTSLASHSPVAVGPVEAAADSVAIIGMSCRFPDAANTERLWLNLCSGVQSIRAFTDDELLQAGVSVSELKNPYYVRAGAILEGVRSFDAEYFGMTGREAVLTSPEQRLLIECAEEALQDAGYGDRDRTASIGVFTGTGFSTYLLDVLGATSCGLESSQGMTLLAATTCAASRVAYLLDLTGPAVTVDTACSSSLVAVHQACRSILRGDCTMALAGGATVRRSARAGYVAEPGGIFSPDGRCRPFDTRANGTVSSSGSGMVLLKRLRDAIADGDSIHAVIRGTAVNNDGRVKAGYTAPSSEGQAAVIRAAMAAGRVEADTIQYLETHGTGTLLGDVIELSALREVFSSDPPRINTPTLGALKANLGHLEAAAGIAGLIKAALVLKHGEIPPAAHFEAWAASLGTPSFAFNSKLATLPVSHAPRRAGVSSFGIGGTNAHAVLEEPPLPGPETGSRPFELLVISAHTSTALRESGRRLAEYLNANPSARFADIAYTLQVGRRRFAHCAYIVASNRAEALELLESAVDAAAQRRQRVSVALQFPGAMPASSDDFRKLYDGEPQFRWYLDECGRLLTPLIGQDVLHLLQAPANPAAVFAVEYSLGQLWLSWGISPSMVLGQGAGEYAAACIAGLVTLPEALEQVVETLRADHYIERVSVTPQLATCGDGRIPFVAAHDAGKALAEFDGIVIGSGGPTPTEGLEFHRALLQELGRVWALGCDVNWRALNASRRVRRISLPTYPFERSEHWIAPHSLQTHRTASIPDRLALSDWFNAAIWEESPSLQESALPTATAHPGCCLLVGGWSELESAISGIVASAGTRLVCVSIGNDYLREGNRITIDWRDSASIVHLFETLEAEGAPVRSMIHCAEGVGVQDPSGRPDQRSLESLYGLLDLSALRPSLRPLLARLIVITRGGHTLFDDSAASPARAILAVLTQVLAKELPQTSCRTIDVAPCLARSDGAEQRALNMLVAEIFSECTDPLVAIRGARRLIRAYRRVRPPVDPEKRSLLRRNGAYLITGGMGGIGWTLARFLAEQLQARLVLTNRSAFPPRHEWPHVLETRAEGPILERIREIQALERAGAQLLVLSADVSSSTDMQRAVARAKEAFGRLDGVIHAAGVAAPDAGQTFSTRRAFRNVITPKIMGTWVLHESCRAEQLAFFACCSSLAAVISPQSLYGYCVGNAFQDAFCDAHDDRAGTRFISIAWDSWKDVGFAAHAASSLQPDVRRSATMTNAISPDEGVQVFRRVLANPAARWIISTCDLNHSLRVGQSSWGRTPVTAPEPPMKMPVHGTASLAAIQGELRLIWMELLGVKSVEATDDFIACGGDSLSIVELAAAIEGRIGRSLPVEKLMTAPTLDAMARLLQETDRSRH